MPIERDRLKNLKDFKTYCLRKLGDGVIQVNISDDQVEDCIYDAIHYCQEFVNECNFQDYYLHKITQEDVDNRYLQLNDNVLEVKDLLFESFFLGSSIYNVFQMTTIAMVNNLNSPTPYMSDWYAMNLNLATLNSLMRPDYPFRYEYNSRRLYIDLFWPDYLPVNSYVAVKMWTAIDPENNISMWNNEYLKRYTIALLKVQWGQNLIKYNGISMPGNTQLNANQILSEGKEELKQVKEDLENFQINPMPIRVSMIG